MSPTYFWGLPSIVGEFLGKASFKTGYLFFIATYGTLPGAAGVMAVRAIRGREIDAYYSVRMPDTWTPVFDLSTPEKTARFTGTTGADIGRAIRGVSERRTNRHMFPRTPAFITELISQPMYNNSARRTANLRVGDDCVGCGLCAMIFPSRCGGRRNVWHYAETAVPVALTAALLISYSARPYGYLPCETGSPYEVKRAAVDCSMIADMLPSKLELYSLAAPSGSTDAAADDVFSALGFTRDRSYKSAYDSVLLYRSTDAQALLWCYNDATFNFTLYSGGESGGSDPFELVYKLLDSIGRPLPAGLTREIADDDEYRLTADFLHSGDEIYNGSVNFSVHDGRLEYLDYELYTMLPLGEEYTLSADGVARLIRRGEFICTGGVMISSEIDEVQCRTVNIVYAGDSKNFYRPMYSIEAVINGGVATILLPAF